MKAIMMVGSSSGRIWKVLTLSTIEAFKFVYIKAVLAQSHSRERQTSKVVDSFAEIFDFPLQKIVQIKMWLISFKKPTKETGMLSKNYSSLNSRFVSFFSFHFGWIKIPHVEQDTKHRRNEISYCNTNESSSFLL